MKSFAPLLLALIFIFSFSEKIYAGGVSCNFTVTHTSTDASCFNSADGSITLTLTGGAPFQTSTKGLLISEFLADPIGTDSPFEFVELIATKNIDFSVTPYTVIFVNNGTATANGWVQGGATTYAFQISTGTVSLGDIVYVGGSSMQPTTNILRAIDTGTSGGDGGIGNGNAGGVLGNGGNNADAVGVFDLPVASLTSSTVPIDAIFFGTAIGNAVVSGGTEGYQLPENDHYSGGKLQSNSFLIGNPLVDLMHKATGVYNVTTNTFSTPRTWVNNATFTEGETDVLLEGLYAFAWSNGATTQNLIGIVSGNWCVTVTDASPCSEIICINIDQPDALSINFTFDDPTCYGLSNGSITADAVGGTAPYVYVWSNNSTAQSLSSLPAGCYFVTVSDANGCEESDFFCLLEPDEILLTFTKTDVSCFGLSNGEAAVSATGGTSVFNYEWNTGDLVSNIDDLTADTYTATVTDDSGCEQSGSITVEQPQTLVITADITHVNCNGVDDGALTLNVAGGTSPFQYEWADDSNITDDFREDLEEGDYDVTVTDNNGCTATTIIIVEKDIPQTLSFVVTDASSSTASDGAIDLTVIGSAPAIEYAWNTGHNTQNISLLPPGTYCVTVTDTRNCAVSGCAEVDFSVGNENVSLDFFANTFTSKNNFTAIVKHETVAHLSVEVYSITGQLMMSENAPNAHEISLTENTSNWSSGIYLVRFRANDKNLVKKVEVY